MLPVGIGPLAILGVILLLAFLVESLVEYLFGPVFDKIPKLTKAKWSLMYIAMAVGIAGAFVYSFDLLYLLGQFLGVEISLTPYGIVLTGMAIGRGSNYLHDILTKFFSKSNTPTQE